jgi:hypothetical protein
MSGSLMENWPSNVREEQRRALKRPKKRKKADTSSLTCAELRRRLGTKISRMRKDDLCDLLRYIKEERRG